MAYTVNIFTLDGCSHCKTLKEELKKQSIPYTEFEVNKFRKIYDAILEITKQDALPTVYLQNCWFHLLIIFQTYVQQLIYPF